MRARVGASAGNVCPNTRIVTNIRRILHCTLCSAEAGQVSLNTRPIPKVYATNKGLTHFV